VAHSHWQCLSRPGESRELFEQLPARLNHILALLADGNYASTSTPSTKTS
jgi:hypothetical protein